MGAAPSALCLFNFAVQFRVGAVTNEKAPMPKHRGKSCRDGGAAIHAAPPTPEPSAESVAGPVAQRGSGRSGPGCAAVAHSVAGNSGSPSLAFRCPAHPHPVQPKPRGVPLPPFRHRSMASNASCCPGESRRNRSRIGRVIHTELPSDAPQRRPDGWQECCFVVRTGRCMTHSGSLRTGTIHSFPVCERLPGSLPDVSLGGLQASLFCLPSLRVTYLQVIPDA